MSQKWNLQDIRPAQPRKRSYLQPTTDLSAQPQVPRPEIASREDIPSIVIEDGNKNGRNRLILSIVLFVFIVGTAVGLSALLGKTELTIHPKHRQPNVNADFVAYPDKRDGELSYEIMTLEATSESQVEATGQVQVKEQATGVIEIIKTTPGAERLITNTRFRTPEGLIFKIKDSVVVPGAVKDNDGASVPGTIQAEVFAEDVGETYNIKAGTTFDVPGFEEGGYTELFKAISARNREPFTNGFDGLQFQIGTSTLETARQALQIDLRNNLLARIQNEKPADFIAFQDAVAITYNQLPAVEYGKDLVTIKEQAILQIPLFDSKDFGSFLARETIPTYSGDQVRVDDPNALSFRYTSPTTSSSVIANEPSLKFNLTGKPLLVWEYDVNKLTKDLAGLPRTAIHNAILAYSGIDSASVRITPFWKRSFPDNAEEIMIIEELKDGQE